jgi:cyclophilin family peptidyl-prolyl cis-trans isomerase
MKYCVFGKVVAGMDVVDAIAKVPTGSKRGHQNVPLEPITILSATVVDGK